jgi:hypothetical protein
MLGQIALQVGQSSCRFISSLGLFARDRSSDAMTAREIGLLAVTVAIVAVVAWFLAATRQA